jgi:thiosulfate dehydrogenase [quinone] large subunit
MVEHATLFGWFVLFSEFAIGLAILIGVAMPLAAFGGASMSLILWLSSTWTVKPYFLGSDTAYLAMWIALLIAIMANKKEKVIPDLSDRRTIFKILAVGVGTAILPAIGSIFKKSSNASATNTSNSSSATGVEIAKLSTLAVGSSLNFKTNDGVPAVLFRTKSGVFAYSRVCTHEGCSVSLDKQRNILACPCHGAEFDPSNGAKVLRGPAHTPLAKISVNVSGDQILLA